MIAASTWVLVMNATRARILRGAGMVQAPGGAELVLRAQMPILRARLEAVAEASRDHLCEDEASFAREVGAFLEAHRLAGDFDRLVVVAAPGVMERACAAMPMRLRALVAARLPKNLVGMSERELPAAVADDLRGL